MINARKHREKRVESCSLKRLFVYRDRSSAFWRKGDFLTIRLEPLY